MAPSPKISVVIFSYNFERFIKECVESVLSQTLRPVEIIVCDDHSTDNTGSIINKLGQQFPHLIKIYQHAKNLGPLYNGAFGSRVASGDFVCFLDGDDRWLPKKLELEWKALQKNPDAQLAYSNVITIDAEGCRFDVWDNNEVDAFPNGDVFIETFSRQFFSNSGSLFRNELVSRFAFSQVAYYDENLESFWDWDRKIRYAAQFHVAYSGAALVERRHHKGGFSKNQSEKHDRAFVEVYEKNFPLLVNRSPDDILRVIVNIESKIISQRKNYASATWLNHYSPDKVMNRVTERLRELPEVSRRNIEHELASPLAKIAFDATEEALCAGNRIDALENYRSLSRYASILNPKYAELGARVLLSPKGFSLLQQIYRKLRS